MNILSRASVLNTKQIRLPFREDRTYIQGADLYNTMIDNVGDKHVYDIRFSVHGFIRNNDCLLYATDKSSEIESTLSCPAHLRCKFDNREHFLCIGENPSGQSRNKRIPYDENRIHELCRIEDTSISIPITSPFSFIETVVSMNKRLMWKLFPEANGQWVLTKIHLDNRFEEQKGFTVQLVHNMELRLVKSRILYAEEQIGHIFFSLIEI